MRALTRIAVASFLGLASLQSLHSQTVVRTGDIAVRGLKATDFPRLTKLAENVYGYEQLDPTKRGLTANNLIVVTTGGVLVAEGQGRSTTFAASFQTSRPSLRNRSNTLSSDLNMAITQAATRRFRTA